MRLELVRPDAPGIEAMWSRLAHDGRPPYFLTWGWIENWLAALPAAERPLLAIVRDAGQPVSAFFLARRRLLRHGVVPSRALFINATGVPRYDELCIEHNGLLGRSYTLAELIEMVPGDWDELFLPAADRAAFRELGVPRDYRVRVERDVASPFIDLERVRTTGDYLQLLSANTRSQIRRARRRIGPCHLEVAGSIAEAFDIYDELVALHTASWRARGEPGAFADPWFDRFHRRLIEQRLAHGEIQLVRLRSGSTTIGCLYNLVSGGRVLFYQSGLAAWSDPTIKPGLVTHAAAIEHGAGAGYAVYDLLAGNGRYKASLATGSTQLCWLRVQRTRLRFALEDRLRSWKHALASSFAARAA